MVLGTHLEGVANEHLSIRKTQPHRSFVVLSCGNSFWASASQPTGKQAQIEFWPSLKTMVFDFESDRQTMTTNGPKLLCLLALSFGEAIVVRRFFSADAKKGVWPRILSCDVNDEVYNGSVIFF